VRLTPIWLACALIGIASTAAAQVVSDASVARIKAALQKPAPRLVLVVPSADFRVNVDAIRPFADLFEVPPWVTPSDGPQAPHIAGNGRVAQFGGVDPGVIGHSISRAVRTRRAHAEVIQAIVEYCAAHRNEPGASGICGGPPR